jgi:phosphoenolpyruvate-protein kinase (PTS system EI component)
MLFSLYIVLYPDVEEGVKLVEIKIRDVDPIAKKKLDEVAKKKKISRQKLLKGIIEMTAFMPEDTKREKRIRKIVRKKNITAMENCYQAMEKMNQFLTLMGQEDLNE